MSLNSFYQISVSVFSIAATILIITLFILAIKIQMQISKLIAKLQEITTETKGFVDRTIESLETFKKSVLTFDFLRQAATEIISQIKKGKGEKSGQKD